MDNYGVLCKVIRAGKRKAIPVRFDDIRPGDTFFCCGMPHKVDDIKALGRHPYVHDLLLVTEESYYGVSECDPFVETTKECA